MLALMRWIARRSLPTLHASGACIGWLAYGLSSSYRARLRDNAALAGLSGAERRAQRVQKPQRSARQPADQPQHEFV